MPTVDAELAAEAQRFAEEIADLIARTVSDDPSIRALARGNRVVVAPFEESGEKVDVPLFVADEHRLSLRIEFLCTWDFAGRYLAIEKSEFALKVPHLREGLIRFDYLRDHTWSPAHVQLHAESSALGWLHARGRHRLRDPRPCSRCEAKRSGAHRAGTRPLAAAAGQSAHPRRHQGRSGDGA